jgi:hypothetical protein
VLQPPLEPKVRLPGSVNVNDRNHRLTPSQRRS